MKTIADIIKEQDFFQELSQQELDFVAGCGKNVVFQEGDVIANPSDPANEFYLLREGHVTLTLEMPPMKPFVFQTLGPNEILGLSWLIPPYLWTVSAKVIERTHAIALDGACLRKKCETDTALGYKLMKHLVEVLVKRENAARLHLLDIYGER